MAATKDIDADFNPITGIKRIRSLGRGTYGKVYEVLSKDGQRYAMKRSRIRSSNQQIFDPGDYQQILKEVQLLTYLKHPNIIKIINFYPGDHFDIILELADGSLEKKVFSGIEFKSICYQLCKGIYYMHNRGAIHHDIKPGNILRKGKRVMISDFGLSTLGLCTTDSDTRLYTLWYRSPEMLLGGNHTFTSDIWALGCTFGELATGKPLFPGNNEKKMLYLIFQDLGSPDNSWPEAKLYPNWNDLFDGFKPNSSFWDKFDPEFAKLLSQILVLNPNDRITSRNLLDSEYFDDVRDEIPEKPNTCLEMISLREPGLELIVSDPSYRIYLFSQIIKIGTYFGSYIVFPLAFEFFDKVQHLYSSNQNHVAVICLYFSSCLVQMNSIDLKTLLYRYKIQNFYELSYNVLSNLKDSLFISSAYDYLILYLPDVTSEIHRISYLFLIIIYMNPISHEYSNYIKSKVAIYFGRAYLNSKFEFENELEDLLDFIFDVKQFIINHKDQIIAENSFCEDIAGIECRNLVKFINLLSI